MFKMTNPVLDAKNALNTLISDALHKAMENGALPKTDDLPAYVVEIPGDTFHGDYASNVAMACARTFKCAPRMVAQAIIENISLEGTYFDRMEIAGPGFLNFFAGKRWFSQVVDTVRKEGADYGRTDFGKKEKVMVEFVSANPTGPMHMGNARGGAIGDCLAAALDWSGHDVTREFYVNDAGNQVAKFGLSLEARYLQIYKGEDAVPFPEDGYHGDDIKVRAQEYADQYGEKLLEADPQVRRQELTDFALPRNIDKLRTDLERYRITYDVWFRESTLHHGAIDEAIQTLTQRGLTYEKDDALWYKATQFGAEKDEVLVRGNHYPTYFAADIAYHYNKFAVRHFDRVINIWGADHHGHVARLKGAMDAIGLDGGKLDIILMQLVRLTRDGQLVKMSKRTGKAISLTDLIDDVPVDAARFFFNMREPNSTLDFDLDLAVEQTSQNPVYYVQYAHARICSILRNLAQEGVSPRDCTLEELDRMETLEEKEMIRCLSRFPQEIVEAAKNYDPARLTHYAIDVATVFHKFYNACRVKTEDESLMQARLNLCLGVKQVICNVLSLLKISAPESM